MREAGVSGSLADVYDISGQGASGGQDYPVTLGIDTVAVRDDMFSDKAAPVDMGIKADGAAVVAIFGHGVLVYRLSPQNVEQSHGIFLRIDSGTPVNHVVLLPRIPVHYGAAYSLLRYTPRPARKAASS